MVLILVILLQTGRGGGVSEVLGGSSTKTIFGTSATKFLVRATAVCAVLFIVTSLSLAVLSSMRARSLMGSIKARAIEFGGTGPVSQEGVVPAEDVGEGAKSEAQTKAGGEEAKDVSQQDVMPTENEKEPIRPKSE